MFPVPATPAKSTIIIHINAVCGGLHKCSSGGEKYGIFYKYYFFFSTLCTPIAHTNGLFGDSEQLFFFPIGDFKYNMYESE